MTGKIIAKTFALSFILLPLAQPAAFAQDEEKDSGKKVDNEVKSLSGISIIGNKEAPKSLYIVPWKSSEVGVESGLNSSLLDPSLQPLDKEVFERELEFYELSLTDE
ncbi:hypothetical protein [Microbulbifer mangrovi]|uniref:hypothetical protein n=1 Tax=Microbulbifer mangrovi TaxID=927787 RepID=UPI001EFAC8DE|nr:hypothetical protein [Microbulbifer mangrovi]